MLTHGWRTTGGPREHRGRFLRGVFFGALLEVAVVGEVVLMVGGEGVGRMVYCESHDGR